MVSLYGNENWEFDENTVSCGSALPVSTISPSAKATGNSLAAGAVRDHPTLSERPVTRRLFRAALRGNGGFVAPSFCVLLKRSRSCSRVCSDVRPKNGGGGFSDGSVASKDIVDGQTGVLGAEPMTIPPGAPSARMAPRTLRTRQFQARLDRAERNAPSWRRFPLAQQPP